MPRPHRASWQTVSLPAAALVLAGCSPPGPSASEKPSVTAIPVKTVAVQQADVQRTTTQPATVRAFYQAEIRARVTGYVRELAADIGDVVDAGAPLAMVDVPEMEKQTQVLEAQVARSEAQEAQAVSGVNLAKANVRSAEARLSQAKSELDRAEASLAAAEAEFTRTEDLVQRQSLERRMLDEVRKKRDSELAMKQSVLSAIESSEADVAVAKAKQAAAEADLQTAQASTSVARGQLEELEVLVDYAVLRAPFDGVVTARSVDPGDLVTVTSGATSTKPLFVVSQTSKLRVQIPVPEVDAALVNRGDKVSLSFPSFAAEEPIEATVSRTSQGLDPSTRTMLVEVEIPNPSGKILPGMFGQATIELSSNAATNLLPARAVRFDESGQAFVYAVDANDTVSVVNVTTGFDNGRSIEILSGLTSGQKVVDAHLRRFASGQKVTQLTN